MTLHALQGHPYSNDDPLPGEDHRPLPTVAVLITLFIILGLVIGFFKSKDK